MAEYYLVKVKQTSELFDFPLFTVTFSSLLGNLYIKKGNSTEEAELEHLYAQEILNSRGKSFCCLKCKLMLEIALHKYFGDLDLDQIQIAPPYRVEFSIEAAKDRYMRVLKVLNNSDWKNPLSCPEHDSTDASPEDIKCAASEETCNCSIQNEAGDNLKKSVKAGSNTNSRAKQKRIRKSKNAANVVVEEKSILNHVGCRISSRCGITSLFPIMRCWHCLPSVVMESRSLNHLINLKWEFVRRQLSIGLLTRIVKCFGYMDQMDEAHKFLLKGISVLVGRNPFRHTFTSIPKDCFHHLVAMEIPGDVFAIQRAEIIYDICWFSLKYYSFEVMRLFNHGERMQNMQAIFLNQNLWD